MIMRFLKRVPAGMMIVPLLIGAFMNTFFPAALKIGSFTTAMIQSKQQQQQHFLVQGQQQQWGYNYFALELLYS